MHAERSGFPWQQPPLPPSEKVDITPPILYILFHLYIDSSRRFPEFLTFMAGHKLAHATLNPIVADLDIVHRVAVDDLETRDIKVWALAEYPMRLAAVRGSVGVRVFHASQNTRILKGEEKIQIYSERCSLQILAPGPIGSRKCGSWVNFKGGGGFIYMNRFCLLFVFISSLLLQIDISVRHITWSAYDRCTPYGDFTFSTFSAGELFVLVLEALVLGAPFHWVEFV